LQIILVYVPVLLILVLGNLSLQSVSASLYSVPSNNNYKQVVNYVCIKQGIALYKSLA
jgi:hypothetical protein